MDALSYALSSIRLTSPLLALISLGGDAAIDMGGDNPPPYACPFHFVISGSLDLIANGVVHPLVAGQMILLPGWPDYRLQTGTPTERIFIGDLVTASRQPQWSPRAGLDTSLFLQTGTLPPVAAILSGIFAFDGPQAAALLHDLPRFMILPGDQQGIADILRAVLALVTNEKTQRPGYAATAARLLEALLIETLRAWTLSTAHGPGRLRGMVDPKLTRTLHVMHSDPGRRWTLDTLAAIAGFSRSSFAHHFRRSIGMTPAAYLKQWRCKLADSRLEDGESIARIASELGYTSSFAFSRAFASVRGMTPARVRHELQEERCRVTGRG